jgi:hypothetical protein
MKTFATMLLASAFTGGLLLPAGAQIDPAPQPVRPGFYSGQVTAATHCVDIDGNVRLKTPATTGLGSSSRGNAVDSPGSAASSSGAIGGADIAAQNLPRC